MRLRISEYTELPWKRAHRMLAGSNSWLQRVHHIYHSFQRRLCLIGCAVTDQLINACKPHIKVENDVEICLCLCVCVFCCRLCFYPNAMFTVLLRSNRVSGYLDGYAQCVLEDYKSNNLGDTPPPMGAFRTSISTRIAM
jgi:hypothetical protein